MCLVAAWLCLIHVTPEPGWGGGGICELLDKSLTACRRASGLLTCVTWFSSFSSCSIIEVYAQHGRKVITATAYPDARSTSIAAFNSGFSQGSVTLINATAWEMGCAWMD